MIPLAGFALTKSVSRRLIDLSTDELIIDAVSVGGTFLIGSHLTTAEDDFFTQSC